MRICTDECGEIVPCLQSHALEDTLPLGAPSDPPAAVWFLAAGRLRRRCRLPASRPARLQLLRHAYGVDLAAAPHISRLVSPRWKKAVFAFAQGGIEGDLVRLLLRAKVSVLRQQPNDGPAQRELRKAARSARVVRQ